MKKNLGNIIGIILVINIFLLYLLIEQYNAREKTKEDSYQTIATANNLIKELQKAENTQKTYLLTRNETILDNYYQSHKSSKEIFEILSKIFNDNPAQVANLEKVKLFMRMAFNKLHSMVKLTQNNQFEQAIYTMKHANSRQYMHKVIKQLTKFVKTEENLLNQKKDDYTQFIVLIFSIIIIGYLVGLIFFILYMRESSQSQRFEKHISKYLKLLDKHVMFTRTDLDGNIIDSSQAFSDICGYTKEELLGKSHNILKNPETPTEVHEKMWSLITKNKSWYGEIANLTKSGEEFWILANIAPEFDEKGKKIGYISFKHNITDKKHLEFKDAQMKDSAKMIALGEMIGNIAHQWRQPLSAISVHSTGILLQHELGMVNQEKLIKSMEDINNNAQYLSETIDTFRNFLKPNKTIETVLLDDVIDSSLSILDASLKTHHIKIKKNIKSKHPIEIQLNQGELSQVLINIINNAKDILIEKKTKDPWINIKMEEKRKHIKISIEDNGGGVPKEIISKVFEPYFTTKHQSKGTGLGLYMSYKIVHESLQGNLYVANTNFGAKFVIELPINEKDDKTKI